MRTAPFVAGLAWTLTGCAPERLAPPDGAGEGARYAEGTPEALLIVRAANELTLAELDDEVPLDRRAATNLVDGRSGADDVDGTDDDTPYATLAEVDAVKYVGEVAMESMLAYASARWPPPPPLTGAWSEPLGLGTSVVASDLGMDDHGNVVVVWSETIGTSREKAWLDRYHPQTGWVEPVALCGGSDGTGPVAAAAGEGYAVWGVRCRLGSATSGSYDGLFHGSFVLGPDGGLVSGDPRYGSSMSIGYYYPDYTVGSMSAAASPGGQAVIELPLASKFGSQYDKVRVEAYDFHWLSGGYDAPPGGPSVVDDAGQRSSAWIVATSGGDRYIYGSGMGTTSARVSVSPDIGYRGVGPSYATSPDGHGVVAWAEVDPFNNGVPGATLGIRRWSAGSYEWEDLDIEGTPLALVATVDRAGTVFVAWIEELDGARDVRAASIGQGAAWADAEVVTIAETTGYGPLSIATDAVGNAFLAWQDRSADGAVPVMWARAAPGAAWTEPGVAVADLHTTWARDVRLVAGGDGEAALAWTWGQLWVSVLAP